MAFITLTLIPFLDYDAEMIARKAMDVAADLCVYTNNNYTVEILEIQDQPDGDEQKK